MNRSVNILLIFVFVLLIMILGVTPAFSRANGDFRVWVEYERGYKMRVEAEIRNSSGQFHYAFDHLNSFVVSLSPEAVEKLSLNPRVVSNGPGSDASIFMPSGKRSAT